jgi:SAM-dependent methyltransferase
MSTFLPPRYLLREFELKKAIGTGDNFLEIGGGNLEFTKVLLKYFNKGVVCDFTDKTKSTFENLPPEIKQRLQLISKDYLTEKMPDKFDLITFSEVLEHVQNDKAFIEKVKAELKDDGRMILAVPAHMSYWTFFDVSVGHIRRYEKKDLIALVESAGFKVTKFVTYGFPFTNLLALPKLLLAKINRKKTANLNVQDRTKISGFQGGFLNNVVVTAIVNRVTIVPFALFASLFNSTDLGEGYIVVAQKAKAL